MKTRGNGFEDPCFFDSLGFVSVFGGGSSVQLAVELRGRVSASRFTYAVITSTARNINISNQQIRLTRANRQLAAYR